MPKSLLRVARGVLNGQRPSRAIPTACGFCSTPTKGHKECPKCGTVNPNQPITKKKKKKDEN